jgi:GNAT superfamily N-acetyltransferase
VLDRETLLRAAASNHRSLFRRQALASSGRIERFGGVDLVLAWRHGTVPFPRSRSRDRIVEVTRRARRLRLRGVGWWSLRREPVTGTLLVARGWEWGWQPHWMARDLSAPLDEPEHEVVAVVGAEGDELPYAVPGPDPPGVHHLGVRRDGETLGHVVVNPWRGVAGIYSMGVVPAARRRGIGKALTLAACRLGRELGCTHAVLNATGEGELLYRTVGFESLGWGQTWWLHPGPPPTPRATALTEALGLGDLRAVEELRPTPAELETPLTRDMVPLALALVTGRPDVAAWLLDRRPDLVSKPIEQRGGTLLHCAVEWDDAAFVELALARGADREARDRWWNGTPLDWAEHLGRAGLAARLRASARA